MSEYLDINTILLEVDRLPIDERSRRIVKQFFNNFAGKRTYFAKYTTSHRGIIETIRGMIESGMTECDIKKAVAVRYSVSRNTAKAWFDTANTLHAKPQPHQQSLL